MYLKIDNKLKILLFILMIKPILQIFHIRPCKNNVLIIDGKINEKKNLYFYAIFNTWRNFFYYSLFSDIPSICEN